MDDPIAAVVGRAVVSTSTDPIAPLLTAGHALMSVATVGSALANVNHIEKFCSNIMSIGSVRKQNPSMSYAWNFGRYVINLAGDLNEILTGSVDLHRYANMPARLAKARSDCADHQFPNLQGFRLYLEELWDVYDEGLRSGDSSLTDKLDGGIPDQIALIGREIDTIFSLLGDGRGYLHPDEGQEARLILEVSVVISKRKHRSNNLRRIFPFGHPGGARIDDGSYDRTSRFRSALVEEGFDEDQVDRILSTHERVYYL